MANELRQLDPLRYKAEEGEDRKGRVLYVDSYIPEQLPIYFGDRRIGIFHHRPDGPSTWEIEPEIQQRIKVGELQLCDGPNHLEEVETIKGIALIASLVSKAVIPVGHD